MPTRKFVVPSLIDYCRKRFGDEGLLSSKKPKKPKVSEPRGSWHAD